MVEGLINLVDRGAGGLLGKYILKLNHPPNISCALWAYPLSSRLMASKSTKQVIKELANPPAISQFVTPYINEYIKKLDTEFVDLDEAALQESIRTNLGNPNWHPKPIVESLRQRFWEEYEVAHRYGVTINEAKIFEGVCEKGVFQKHMEDAISLAWILCRPPSYEQTIQHLLNQGYRRFAEVLNLPIKDKMGIVNEKLIDQMVKITAMMDLRSRGGYTQRSEQLIRQQVEHTHSNSKEVQAQVMDIDERIKELETKLLESKGLLPAPNGTQKET